jgi:acyl carrier protein
MLPSAILTIPALPLTANGKADRWALPDPSHALAAEAAVRRFAVAPRAADEIETLLAALWCEVLDCPQVGPEDDFFELGGHSLLALRLFALIERRFGRMLPLAVLFESRTLRALAAALRDDAPATPATPATPARSCVVPVQPHGRRTPLFFVSGWGGALLAFASLARAFGPDQPAVRARHRGVRRAGDPLDDAAGHRGADGRPPARRVPVRPVPAVRLHARRQVRP